MSGAAEDYVETLAVKGSARDLLRIIARHVPEGGTTTPVIRIADLATLAQLHRRTVHKWVGELVDSGEITVMDGGRGKKARYTLVHLTGARPMTTAPLPLRADLRPVARRRLDTETLDLFDQPEGDQTAIKRVVIDHTLAGNVWRSITRFVLYVWRSITRWPKRVVIDHTLVPPLDVDDARARDVLQLSTTTSATTDAPAFTWPPCRWHRTTHAWCDGRVHVPMNFHREERRRLARAPGETDADLDARLFSRYAEILAAIPDTEEIRDKNEFEFWKRQLRSVANAVGPHIRASSAGSRRRPDIPNTRACPHQPPCEGDTDACVERSMAEWRARQERQSG